MLAAITRPINKELLELYEAAGCECPSDVEKSDSEDEDEDVYEEAVEHLHEDLDDSCAGEYTQDSGYGVHTPDIPLEAAALQQRARAERKWHADQAYFDAPELVEEDEEEEDDLGHDEEGDEESLGDADTDEEEDALRQSESESGSIIEDEEMMDELRDAEIVDLTNDEDYSL